MDFRLVKVRIGIKANGSWRMRRVNIFNKNTKRTSKMFQYKLHWGEDTRADLQALQHIQKVIHPSQMVNILENGDQQCRCDGDGAGQQHPCKTRPPQVQETLKNTKAETSVQSCFLFFLNRGKWYLSKIHCANMCSYLHHKLSRVRARHGGALPSCQNTDSPDVESCWSKETPQDDPLNACITQS